MGLWVEEIKEETGKEEQTIVSNNNFKEFYHKGEQTNRVIERRGAQEKAFLSQEELQQNNSIERGNDDGEGRETCQRKPQQMRCSAGGERLSSCRSLASSAMVKGSNNTQKCAVCNTLHAHCDTAEVWVAFTEPEQAEVNVVEVVPW